MTGTKHYLKEELYELMRSDPSVFEFLQAGSLDGIWYWDLEHPEHEWMSERFWEVFGHDPASKRHLASEWQDMIHPDDLELALENLEAHKADPAHPYDQVVRYRHLDGSTVWVRCRGLIIRDEDGKPRRMLGAHTELTAVKLAEEAATRARDFAESIIATVRQPLVVLDKQLRVVSVNRAFCQSFRVSQEDATGQPFAAIGGGSWNDAELLDRLGEVFHYGEEVVDFELQHDSGTIGRRLLLLNARKLFRPGNGSEAVLLSIEDVTERRLVEAESQKAYSNLQRRLETRARQLEDSEADLSRTEGLLLSFFEAIPFGVLVLDKDARPYFANEHAVEILGNGILSRGLAGAAAAYRAGTMDPYPADEMPLVQALNGKACAAMDIEVERTGGRLPLWVSAAPIRDDRGEIVFGLAVFRDVSEERKLEEQYRQAQRLEAVGRLAGGVAHDLNNLLTAVFSFGRFVLARLNEADPAHADMQEVLRAAGRGETLTRQLLSFSRHRTVEPRVLNINEQVRNTDNLLRRILGEDVELCTRLEEGLWNVRVDPGALEQVLVNLAINARDAMLSGGKLTITTENRTVSGGHGTRKAFDVPPGDYAVVSVSDNGIGMDERTQQQAFEPFFTTKAPGKGTGLGLSTCYGIIKQAEGHIRVASELGAGATFVVYLPRNTQEAQPLETPTWPAQPDGHETILVAEDDPQVRLLASRILEKHGYSVLTAKTGDDALRICEQKREEIGLLLTDVVMPRMGGKQLVERLRRVSPDMRVLFMSGYPENAIADQGVLEEGTALLAKPFTPERLAAAVRSTLDAEAPEARKTAALPRVLVIDDDSQTLRAMRRMLAHQCEAVAANNAAEALDLLERESFDLVLCDLVMPDMSGLELHEHLRDRNPQAADRFVFFTGQVGTRLVDTYLSRKDHRPVLYKPVEPDDLRAFIASV